MSRKGLNDHMYGSKGHSYSQKPSDSWEAFEAKQKGGAVVPFEPTYEKAVKAGPKKDDVHYYAGGERCYHKHPPLKLPGTELLIYGGSCSAPVVKDADIYIGFDESMRFTERSYPWKQGFEFLFKIRDMSVPEKPEEFKKLVGWVKAQVEGGKKVHCGCIGGHGRTGTFLAALCSEFGEKDAISYVRKNYCQKAVESNSQVAFLAEHFGITRVDGYKTGATYSGKSSGTKTTGSTSGQKSSGGGFEKFTHVAGNGCIWDAPAA